MTSPKLDGLAYLQTQFGELTVPTTFITDVAILETVEFDERDGCVYRVRTGRTSGSEMEAPYASFAIAAEALAFLRSHMEADEEVVGVVHAVDLGYFRAQVVGSLLVGSDGSLFIELQTVTEVDLGRLHQGSGSRPRDWAVDVILRVGPGEALTNVPPRHLTLIEDLEALIGIGRHVHDDLPDTDCVVRFNLYADELLVLDDFRRVDAFQGAVQ